MISLSPAALKGGIALAIVLAASGAGAKVTSVFYEEKLATARADLADARVEAATTTRELELTQLELSGAIIAKNAVAHRKLRILTSEIRTEVIKYVQDPTINRYELPSEFVRIHDKAASTSDRMPSDTGTPSRADAGTTSITDADLLAVVTSNYESCLENAADLVALQEWATSLQTLNQ